MEQQHRICSSCYVEQKPRARQTHLLPSYDDSYPAEKAPSLTSRRNKGGTKERNEGGGGDGPKAKLRSIKALKLKLSEYCAALKMERT